MEDCIELSPTKFNWQQASYWTEAHRAQASNCEFSYHSCHFVALLPEFQGSVWSFSRIGHKFYLLLSSEIASWGIVLAFRCSFIFITLFSVCVIKSCPGGHWRSDLYGCRIFLFVARVRSNLLVSSWTLYCVSGIYGTCIFLLRSWASPARWGLVLEWTKLKLADQWITILEVLIVCLWACSRGLFDIRTAGLGGFAGQSH